MFECRHLLGLFGVAALVAGFFVFGAAEISTNWVRWLLGPLLWFIGFGMLVAWGGKMIASTQAKQDQQEQAKRLAKAASTQGEAR